MLVLPMKVDNCLGGLTKKKRSSGKITMSLRCHEYEKHSPCDP